MLFSASLTEIFRNNCDFHTLVLSHGDEDHNSFTQTMKQQQQQK